ncbi:hypothetical protein ACFXO9_31380 [Nocardia tengchongensis]|uniref:hypothetical protein n=1 Tax=Nocardia tengchongensis TaxID=2055889 RepID=UPI003674B7AD
MLDLRLVHSEQTSELEVHAGMTAESRQCVRCGRQGTKQFVPLDPRAPVEAIEFVCTGSRQCRFRQQRTWRREGRLGGRPRDLGDR